MNITRKTKHFSLNHRLKRQYSVFIFIGLAIYLSLNSCDQKQPVPKEYQIIYRNKAGEIRCFILEVNEGIPRKKIESRYEGIDLFEAYFEESRDSLGYVALGDIYLTEKERDMAMVRFRYESDSIFDHFISTPDIFGEQRLVKGYVDKRIKQITAKMGELIFIESVWRSYNGSASSFHTNSTEIWKKVDSTWVVQDTADFAELTRKFNLKNQDILRNGNYTMRWKGNDLCLVEYNVADMPERDFPIQNSFDVLDSLRLVDKKLVFKSGDSLIDLIGSDFENLIGIEELK